jgi:L-rhamnose-H+ transport protein
MVAEAGLGIGLVALGGFLNGSFALPMKRMPHWSWENTWLLYSIAGMILLPFLLATATVPHWLQVFHATSFSTLAEVALFGFGWGIGSTLFGLGIDWVGMAFGFSVTLGTTASVGTLLPLLALHPEKIATCQGLLLLGGLGLVVVGIVLCAMAGGRRQRDLGQAAASGARSSFAAGLVICILSGVFSAMLNFSFVFGEGMKQASLRAGASPAMAANPLWALALGAGFLANAGYCLYRLRKNRTWSGFARKDVPFAYWFGGLAMGVLWFGGIATYGFGATTLGELGGIVGWPVFMAVNIGAANVWGALTGEWKGASRAARSYSLAGLTVFILAIYVTALGGGA